MLASQNHDDFDEMKDKFLAMAQANPALGKEALAARHPWEKAYQIAAKAAKTEALGAVDVDDLEAKLRAKIMAEMAETQQQPAPVMATLPPTLSNERNVGQRTGPAWAGPRPLSELLS
jgi:hypothetical protein